VVACFLVPILNDRLCLRCVRLQQLGPEATPDAQHNAAYILSGIVGGHFTPLAQSIAQPCFLSKLFEFAFAPSVSMLVPPFPPPLPLLSPLALPGWQTFLSLLLRKLNPATGTTLFVWKECGGAVPLMASQGFIRWIWLLLATGNIFTMSQKISAPSERFYCVVPPSDSVSRR